MITAKELYAKKEEGVAVEGEFNPKTVAEAVQKFIDEKKPFTHLVIGKSLVETMKNKTEWLALFDPCHRHEILKHGYIGVCLGLDVLTDSPDVIPDDYAGVFSAPQHQPREYPFSEST